MNNPRMFILLAGLVFSLTWVSQAWTADERKGTTMTGQSKKFDYVVSFASIGSGIDQSTRDMFNTYLKSLGEKVSFLEVPWGLEGEIDYCIDLSENAASERHTIQQKFEEILGKGRYIEMNTNSACAHAGGSGS